MPRSDWSLRPHYLEVVHQAVLTAALLADGEVVAQRAGGVRAVHRVAHRVVVVAGGIPDDARACGRKPTHTLTYCDIIFLFLASLLLFLFWLLHHLSFQ